MAAERIPAEQDDVEEHHQSPDADAEMNVLRYRILEPERLVNIGGEQDDEEKRDVHEVAMDVLQDEGEPTLAPVALARLADRAGGRISPERFVVGPAVVIAGEAKPARRPEDQQGGRKDQPARPPGWLLPNQACSELPKISGE